MKPEVLDQLHRLNQEFYQTFSHSFSDTRGRIQPGVSKILDEIHGDGDWLDIGCGNGNLAAEWVRRGKTGRYLGIDFSAELLEIAREKIHSLFSDNESRIRFLQVDILDKNWAKDLPNYQWDGIMMFAVLHHIPGEIKRKEIIHSIRNILAPGKPLYFSVWQIQNSQRLSRRMQPWERIGLDGGQVEQGDVLMDWRAPNAKSIKNNGLRYVHIFSEIELEQLAMDTGFRIMESFYSDGREGNLALYQKWF